MNKVKTSRTLNSFDRYLATQRAKLNWLNHKVHKGEESREVLEKHIVDLVRLEEYIPSYFDHMVAREVKQ